MSKYLPLVISVIATVSAALALPSQVAAHPVIAMVLAAAAQVLHAALPSIFGVGDGSK